MALILMLLAGGGAVLQILDFTEPAAHGLRVFVWNGFLFGIPLVLAGFLLANMRWALMAGVIYGTIGLALDISTLVHEVIGDHARYGVLVLTLGTGLLNFLLIVLGGRGFLAVGSDATPRR